MFVLYGDLSLEKRMSRLGRKTLPGPYSASSDSISATIGALTASSYVVRWASKYFLELSSSSPMKNLWHSSSQPRKAVAMSMARISPDGNRENSRHGFGDPGWSDRDLRPQARLQDAQAGDRGGRRSGSHRAAWRDLRIPGSQRRRQDDHPAHAGHASASQRRHGQGGGVRPRPRARQGPQADRLRQPGGRLRLRGGRAVRAGFPGPPVWHVA